MPSDSFTWWLINFLVAVGFMAAALLSGNWLFAFGGLISAGVMMVSGLAGTSSEDGSADELPPLVFPPDSATQGDLHSEEQLTGGQAQTSRK